MARIPYLTELIPKTGLLAWQSLDEPANADGAAASSVRDEQASFNLASASSQPLWKELLTGEQYINFSGSNVPLASATVSSVTVRHLFVIAAYSGAGFGAEHRGLVSETGAVDGILLGESGSSKFFDFGYSSSEYRKSGTLHAAGDMQAPMNNIPELIEFKVATGFPLTSLQIGQHRTFTARRWSGPWYVTLIYNRVLSDAEIERIRLYANLRARLWDALGQTLTFPSPTIVTGQPTYSHFDDLPLNFDAITDEHTYEDESKSFNQANVLPPRAWKVEFYKLSNEKAQILDAFWENVRKVKTFNFYDYRRDKTYTGVRVSNYSRSHSAHESYKKTCSFGLVKY